MNLGMFFSSDLGVGDVDFLGSLLAEEDAEDDEVLLALEEADAAEVEDVTTFAVDDEGVGDVVVVDAFFSELPLEGRAGVAVVLVEEVADAVEEVDVVDAAVLPPSLALSLLKNLKTFFIGRSECSEGGEGGRVVQERGKTKDEGNTHTHTRGLCCCSEGV